LSIAGNRAAAPEQAAVESLAIRPDEHWPFYADDEIAAVVGVLRSGKVNQWTGPDVAAFEEAMTERFGGGQGVALANGSLALELALRAYHIGPGDEVVVTPRTFMASASCVRLVGATPVFAEVNRDSGNITAETIAAVLTPRTKAVIPVHLAGWPCDMKPIMALAAQHGLVVIEDCAQSHGAMIDGRPAGSFGHAAAFSFCQDKIMSTGGEGGFTSFQDPARFEWAWSYKDHGKNLQKVKSPPLAPGFRWLHDSIGTNWRLTGPQAAIGLAQLQKLDGWHAARERNAALWRDALSGVAGLRIPAPRPGLTHAQYKFYCYVEGGADAERKRDEILRRAGAAGLRVFSGSCSEVYLEEAFSDMDTPRLPIARELGATSLMVEVHPTLRPERVEQRAAALAAIAADVLG
jgi:dTDP-4-amino-4,6-dideoxygalactose transaminase